MKDKLKEYIPLVLLIASGIVAIGCFAFILGRL